MHPDEAVLDSPKEPPHTHSKGIGRVLPFDIAPRRVHHDRAPPPYSEWDGIKGPRGSRLSQMRAGHSSTQRHGGCLKWVLLILIAILIIIALIVGLVVGLHDKHHHSSSYVVASSLNPLRPVPTNPSLSDNTSSPTNQTAPAFPAGSYSLVTFLSTVATSCTSNPSTWTCYPYTTYNQSTAGSMTTFNWIITPSSSSSSSSSPSYVISSTQNPFSITFTNATLTLTNPNTSTEAYTFSIPLDKIDIPTTALTPDDSASECMFNTTTFTAHLYTKRPKVYPGDSVSNSTTGAPYQDWPYAVDVMQSIEGGGEVPACYKTVNGGLGDRINLATEPETSQCSCTWMNYGT